MHVELKSFQGGGVNTPPLFTPLQTVLLGIACIESYCAVCSLVLIISSIQTKCTPYHLFTQTQAVFLIISPVELGRLRHSVRLITSLFRHTILLIISFIETHCAPYHLFHLDTLYCTPYYVFYLDTLFLIIFLFKHIVLLFISSIETHCVPYPLFFLDTQSSSSSLLSRHTVLLIISSIRHTVLYSFSSIWTQCTVLIFSIYTHCVPYHLFYQAHCGLLYLFYLNKLCSFLSLLLEQTVFPIISYFQTH